MFYPQSLSDADLKPADKTERYTGMNLDALKPVAEVPGKTLML